MTDKKQDWMNTKWRPAMGWMYMTICIFDFILFPILWAIIQSYQNGAASIALRQWDPLTLQGAGLFHMAMGAVLGVAAWSRGQEKLAGVADQQAQYQQPQQNYYQQSAYVSQTPVYSNGTYMTSNRKLAPILQEPEL